MIFPDDNQEIQTPGDFRRLLRQVKDALNRGDLRQLTSGMYFVDVLTLSESGQWPDIVQALFEDTRTGIQYQLYVDTYRAGSGSWTKAA